MGDITTVTTFFGLEIILTGFMLKTGFGNVIRRSSLVIYRHFRSMAGTILDPVITLPFFPVNLVMALTDINNEIGDDDGCCHICRAYINGKWGHSFSHFLHTAFGTGV